MCVSVFLSVCPALFLHLWAFACACVRPFVYTGYTEHVALAGLSTGYVLSVSGFRRVQNAKIRRGRRFNKICFFKCFNGCTLLICRPMFGRCVSLTAIDRPEFIST